MSDTLVQRPTPASSSTTIEIINVDDYNIPEHNVRNSTVRTNGIRTGNTPQEVIYIDDSDDEVQIITRPEGIPRPHVRPANVPRPGM